MILPTWAIVVILVCVAMCAGCVGAFVGVQAGIAWERWRVERSLERKRKAIFAAMKRDEQ